MTDVILVFKDFKFNPGIFNSPWAKENGFQKYHYYWLLKKFDFPVPIILTLLFNKIKNVKLKRQRR
jgi:putative aldouronate transport system permease protein